MKIDKKNDWGDGNDLPDSLQPASLPEGPARDLVVEGAGSAVTGDFDHALDRFIEAIRDDRTYADDLARRLCPAIFRQLGEEHEITRKHRKAFNGALY